MAGANGAARGSVESATGAASEVDTLWLDVSALLLMPNKYTAGIPRTIRKISQAWISSPWTRTRFCALVPDYGFVEVNPSAFQGIIDLDRPEIKHPPGAEPWKPKRVGSRLWFLPMPLRRRVRTAVRGLKHLVFKTPLRFPPYTDGHLTYPVKLGPRDLLFSLGGLWVVPEVQSALMRVRREQNFRMVSLIYDLIPIFAQHLTNMGHLLNFEGVSKIQMAESDVLLTISQYSRQDVLRYSRERGVPCGPVAVFTLGSDIRPANSTTAGEPPVHDRPFVLTVGTIEARKNHAGMYAAWRRLLSTLGPERTPDLIIAGNIGWQGEEVVDQILADRSVRGKVIIKEGPTDRQLDWLYKNCLFTIYPSLYEGWGLPVEESLIYGKMCVTTTASSLPEVGREFADYVEPGDVEALVAGVTRALDPHYRAERERHIRERFRPNTWEDAAHELEGILRTHFRFPEQQSEARAA